MIKKNIKKVIRFLTKESPKYKLHDPFWIQKIKTNKVWDRVVFFEELNQVKKRIMILLVN